MFFFTLFFYFSKLKTLVKRLLAYGTRAPFYVHSHNFFLGHISILMCPGAFPSLSSSRGQNFEKRGILQYFRVKKLKFSSPSGEIAENLSAKRAPYNRRYLWPRGRIYCFYFSKKNCAPPSTQQGRATGLSSVSTKKDQDRRMICARLVGYRRAKYPHKKSKISSWQSNTVAQGNTKKFSPKASF